MRQTTDEHRRRLEEVIDGHAVDPSEFAYDFDANHLAVIATGPDSAALVGRLAADLGRELLWLAHAEGETLAWWGGAGEFVTEDFAAISAAAVGREGRLAVGQPARGPEGWRRSHRQARTAFDFPRCRPRPFVRYREVALLAAVLGDEDLSAFLRQSFLEPLLAPGSGDQDLANALRVYLDSGGDLSSTALALGVSRQSVADQMSAIEERVGKAPFSCPAEFDLALRLDEITSTETANSDKSP